MKEPISSGESSVLAVPSIGESTWILGASLSMVIEIVLMSPFESL